MPSAQVFHDWQLSSLDSSGSAALEFEACQLQKRCPISLSVNPSFHHPILIPDHLLHQIGMLAWNIEVKYD
eukprot:1143906-Pelagomonas_calceolata.AAC.4